MTLVEEFKTKYEEEKNFRKEKKEQEQIAKDDLAKKWVEAIENALRKTVQEALENRLNPNLPSKISIESEISLIKNEGWCIRIGKKDEDRSYITLKSNCNYLSKDEIFTAMDVYLRKSGIKKEGKDGTNVMWYYVEFD